MFQRNTLLFKDFVNMKKSCNQSMCQWRPSHKGSNYLKKTKTKNDAVRIVEYLCHTGCSMSLNFPPKSSSIMLVQKQTKENVCFVMRKPRTVQRRFQEVAFIFSFFNFFIFLQRGRSFLRLHTRFALLAQVAPRASAYFITSRCHCCTEGIFFFLSFFFFLFVQGQTLMYKSSFCPFVCNGTTPQASRYCRAVDLDLWVLAFVPVCLDEQRKPFPPQL